MPALASNMAKTLNANYMDIKLVIDGVEVVPKDAVGNIVEPFVVDGTTYLPVRAVGEALGKEVTWDGNTKTVYVGEVPAVEKKTSVIGSFMEQLPNNNIYNAKDLPHIAAAIEETNSKVDRNHTTNSLALRPKDAYTTGYIYLESHVVQEYEGDKGHGELWITGLGNYYGDVADGSEDYLKLVRAILEDVISDKEDFESVMDLMNRLHEGARILNTYADHIYTEAEYDAVEAECDDIRYNVHTFNTVIIKFGYEPTYSKYDAIRIISK